MPRLFLHICGESGVGKKTLVEKLVEDTEPGLRRRFDIAGGTVAAYGSVSAFYIRPMDLYTSATEDYVIHNWQLDTHDWIERSRQTNPAVDQRTYVLWCPYDIHRERIIKRPDLNKYYLIEQKLKLLWRDHMVPRFRDLENRGFRVEVIDASKSGYPTIPEWPD